MAQAQRVLVHLLPNSPGLFAEACCQLFRSLFFPLQGISFFFPPSLHQDPINPHFTFTLLISFLKAKERSLGAHRAINTTSYSAGMVSTAQWSRWGRRNSGFWVLHGQSPSQTLFPCGAREQDPTSHTFLPPTAENSRLHITPGKKPEASHLLPGGGPRQTPTTWALVSDSQLLQWVRTSGAVGERALLIDTAMCSVAANHQSEGMCFSQFMGAWSPWGGAFQGAWQVNCLPKHRQASSNKVWGSIHHLTPGWTEVSAKGTSFCTTLGILSPTLPSFTTFWRLHLGRRPSPRHVRFRTLQSLE